MLFVSRTNWTILLSTVLTFPTLAIHVSNSRPRVDQELSRTRPQAINQNLVAMARPKHPGQDQFEQVKTEFRFAAPPSKKFRGELDSTADDGPELRFLRCYQKKVLTSWNAIQVSTTTTYNPLPGYLLQPLLGRDKKSYLKQISNAETIKKYYLQDPETDKIVRSILGSRKVSEKTFKLKKTGLREPVTFTGSREVAVPAVGRSISDYTVSITGRDHLHSYLHVTIKGKGTQRLKNGSKIVYESTRDIYCSMTLEPDLNLFVNKHLTIRGYPDVYGQEPLWQVNGRYFEHLRKLLMKKLNWKMGKRLPRVYMIAQPGANQDYFRLTLEDKDSGRTSSHLVPAQ